MIRLGSVIQALCLLAAVVMGLTYKRLSRRSADVRPRLLPIREPSPNYILHSNHYLRGDHSTAIYWAELHQYITIATARFMSPRAFGLAAVSTPSRSNGLRSLVYMHGKRRRRVLCLMINLCSISIRTTVLGRYSLWRSPRDATPAEPCEIPRSRRYPWDARLKQTLMDLLMHRFRTQIPAGWGRSTSGWPRQIRGRSQHDPSQISA